MQNHVCFNEFSLSQHRHKLNVPELSWHQSYDMVFLPVTRLHALMIDTSSERGLPTVKGCIAVLCLEKLETR